MKTQLRQYMGVLIDECERTDGQHSGKWVILTKHPTGMYFADELCAHFWTLKETKEYIRENKEYF